MDDLLAARSQMAMSLSFHIIFAIAGMAMPLMTAILFAVGAVSGTFYYLFKIFKTSPQKINHEGNN
jgi:cytochrome d ubiquinol oxidase subunit I